MPTFILLVLFALASLLPSEVNAAPLKTRRFVVTRSGGGLGIDEQEQTILWRIGHDWFGERSYRGSNWCGVFRANRCEATVIENHVWIDGRACDRLATSVAAFDSAWQADPGAKKGFGGVASDTPMLTLHSFTDSYGTKADHNIVEYYGVVVAWWKDVSLATASCWQNEIPVVHGHGLIRRVGPIETN